MMNLQTKLHHYSYHLGDPEQEKAYKWLRENTLTKLGFKVHNIDMRYGHQTKEALAYLDRLKEIAGNVELETKHLFSDQWNSKQGVRLFNWVEVIYENRNFKEGYWLEQTQAMHDVLTDTLKCGHCGNMEPKSSGKVFCHKCLGSTYLKADDLHILRLRPVKEDRTKREPLSEAEKAELLPLYREAQLKAAEAEQAKVRKEVEENFQKLLKAATNERDGFLWLLDKGLKTENVIYYSHKDIFSFGWRNAISPVVLEELKVILQDFPFNYEFQKK